VSVLHCKRSYSRDDVGRRSGSHCAEDISEQKTTETEKTTQ
jgi:hypothetical protein